MSTDAIGPLRQRMIEDMRARKLNPHTQRNHTALKQLHAVRRVFEAFARHGYSRRDPPVPAAPD